jgi:hypothetical protein
MRKNTPPLVVSISIIIGVILAACGQFQTDLNGQPTQMTVGVVATQAAEKMISTDTNKPTNTPPANSSEIKPLDKTQTPPTNRPTNATTPDTRTTLYESAEHPFTIQYPENLNDIPLSEEDREFFAAQYISADEEEFLAIVEEDLNAYGLEKASLSEYTNLIMSSLDGELNFVLRRQITTPQGQLAEILEFEADGGSFLGIRFVHLFDNRIGFSATFIAPREKFYLNRPIYEQTFSTFQVTK